MTTFPKPEPRAKTKAREAREDAAKLKVFRDAVWAREQLEDCPDQHGRCQTCRRVVMRSGPAAYCGEVHHIISRRHKATWYEPANGRLLCRACHRTVTERRS